MLSTQALNGGDTIVLNVGLGNRCYSVDSLVPLDPSEPTDFDVIDYYIGDDCATCNIDYPCPSPMWAPGSGLSLSILGSPFVVVIDSALSAETIG